MDKPIKPVVSIVGRRARGTAGPRTPRGTRQPVDTRGTEPRGSTGGGERSGTPPDVRLPRLVAGIRRDGDGAGVGGGDTRVTDYVTQLRAMLGTIANGVSRRSPTHPMRDHNNVLVLADLASGTLSFDTDVAGRMFGGPALPLTQVAFGMAMHLDAGTALVDPRTIAELTERSRNKTNGLPIHVRANAKALAAALSQLQGMKVFDPLPAAPAVAALHDVDHTTAMRAALTQMVRHFNEATGDGCAMTILGGRFNFDPGVLFGTLQLSDDGLPIGLGLRRGVSSSPRGTVYQTGRPDGVDVDVTIWPFGEEPLLLAYDRDPDRVPARTRAALASLWKAQQAQREAFLRDHPFAVEITRGRGMATLFSSLERLQWEPKDGAVRRTTAQLLRSSDGQYRVVQDTTEADDGWNATLALEIQSPSGLMMSWLFSYTVVEGDVPEDARAALDHAQYVSGVAYAQLNDRLRPAAATESPRSRWSALRKWWPWSKT